MKEIRVRFDADAPESYKMKTIKKIVALGWVQHEKKYNSFLLEMIQIKMCAI